MLYVTTRDNREVYTAHKALTENRAPDGGFYVPFRMPGFSAEEIEALQQKSFGQCVAEMLNRLFDTKLTAWDVECTIGRSSARINPMTQRILVAELWHNLEWDFQRTVSGLMELLTGNSDCEVSDWAGIGIRIAVLFGLFGKLMRKGLVSVQNPIDLAVLSGDFSAPMAAWYARQWGLPIGTIILCCNENNNPWELLHHGAFRTGTVAVRTITPDGDYVVPRDLERFISACGGSRETERFVEDCRLGRMYVPSEIALENMRAGMYASVVSQSRVASAIPNVHSSHGQILEPYGALVYSGLMDYRARTGEGRNGVILCEKGPGADVETTAWAMSQTPEQLRNLLKINE